MPVQAGEQISLLLYVNFDGVLHPTTGKDLFCRMHLLEEALIGKDCQIIISSSCRFHHPFQYLLGLFPESLRVDRSPASQETLSWADDPTIAKS